MVYYESSLTHHGIKGQKWGIRRFQNEDGTLTSAGKSRYASLDRAINRVNRRSEITMKAREKNRAKRQRHYDKKIAKATDRTAALQTKKKEKLADFDLGTKFVKAGYDRYSKIISDYKNVKLKAFEDKAFKKDPEYKKAVLAYTNQIISDMVWGMEGTTMNYSSETARKYYAEHEE
jgi:hypothetical protein